jgi:nucleoside-diphosphate kinase
MGEHIERALVLIKPDGLRRGISMNILSRFERVGLKIIGLKMVHVNREFAEKHYTHEDITVRHGEAIRNQLLDYITEGPVIAAVLEGVASVKVIRKLCGSTEPATASPGTIRGDYCHQSYALSNDVGKAIYNVIHASATTEEGVKESELWFSPSELVEYRRSDEAEHRYQ